MSAMALGVIASEVKPLWEIPMEKCGMEFSRANAFDVPQASAIPDHNAFTIEMDLKFAKAPGKFSQPLMLLDESTGGTGFSMQFKSYNPVNDPKLAYFGLFFRLNDGNYEARMLPASLGELTKLRFKFRNGLVIISQQYQGEWRQVGSYIQVISPNGKAIRVCDVAEVHMNPNLPDLDGVTLEGLRFYGADYEVFAENEDRKPAEGILSGHGFSMEVPLVEDKERPRILYVGDSISMGYHRYLRKLLENRAYGYHLISFWAGDKPPLKPFFEQFLVKPLDYRKYDVILFNNGLHSLNWNESVTADDEIRAHYADAVDVMRELAPQAKLVYLMTTPHTGKRGADGKVHELGELDPVVLRLNRIASEVMKAKGVEVVDAYTPLSRRLDLADGDGFHWKSDAYEIIAKLIADHFFSDKTIVEKSLPFAASIKCPVPKEKMQETVQKLLDEGVAAGWQDCAQCCVYIGGEKVVDAWAGTMDRESKKPIDGDTLLPIFSTEKPLLATAMHIAKDRGLVAYDDPVAKYWPEFTGDGREKLTVRDLLSHRAGMPPGFNEPTERLADWAYMIKTAAAAKPISVPGTRTGYLSQSYAWYVGVPLERIYGCPINDLLTENVLKPAGIEHDFYFAVPDSEMKRCATVYADRESDVFLRMNDPVFRRACIPSAYAVSNARGVAKFYNRLAGMDGKKPLISPEALAEASVPYCGSMEELPSAEEMVSKWQMLFGLGWGVWGDPDDLGRIIGQGGIGGSEGYGDVRSRIAIGYTCGTSISGAGHDLRDAIYKAVGIRTRHMPRPLYAETKLKE